MYGSQCSYPEMRLSVFYVNALSIAVQVKAAADSINNVAVASPNNSIYDDFQRIVFSIIHPIQVQLRIVYDGKLPLGIAVFSAFCVKLLLSSSLFARNVIPASWLHD